jgi:hypothetical protein
MDFFADFIAKTYGKKTADGRSFLKSPEITEHFVGSGAYDVLFTELVLNADAAVDFINAVLPKAPNPPPQSK